MSLPSDNLSLHSKGLVNGFRRSLVVQQVVMQQQRDRASASISNDCGIDNAVDNFDFRVLDKPNLAVVSHAPPPDCEGARCADLKADSSKIFRDLVNPTFTVFPDRKAA